MSANSDFCDVCDEHLSDICEQCSLARTEKYKEALLLAGRLANAAEALMFNKNILSFSAKAEILSKTLNEYNEYIVNWHISDKG